MHSSSQSSPHDLNPQQLQGVHTSVGPVLVLAGAGSGKTKMLTSRVVHLIRHHNIAPHNILAVTFTNKAAGEMRARVLQMLAFDAVSPNPFGQPQIGTFHSICAQILRREITRTPFSQQFVIYDDSDQLSLIKECLTKLNLSDKIYSPRGIQYAINHAKCWVQEPHQMQNREFRQVYEVYQTELYRNNAIDFGEIILMAYRLFRDNADVLSKYQDWYRFIHIDEYQDTNRAQYLLVKLLASRDRNICVVGDEDQSIYKWRGADIRNILDFEKDYPEAKVIKLEQNYRSTKIIIEASSHLISNNVSRKAKTLWTDNARGEPIFRFQVPDERTEAELVVNQLQKQCENGFAYGDNAIFYRTNAQSRVFEDILRRERIPYKIVGGLRFYDRKEIKDVLAYFRVLTNPADSISFKRIINVPQRSIGRATVDKIDEFATRIAPVTFESALKQATHPQAEVLSGAALRKVAEFAVLLDRLRELLEKQTLSEFYHELLDRIGYVRELKEENTEESLSRIENLQEFDSILVDFEDEMQRTVNASPHYAKDLLPLFLENVALVGEETLEDQAATEAIGGTVSLMTLHTSKGLEFPVVFMVGLEEGLFPSIRNGESSEETIEEERRLCYVGMTRAKSKLFITHAICRRVYGNIFYHEPARFLEELPSECVQFIDLTRRQARPNSSVHYQRSTNVSKAGQSVVSGLRLDPSIPRIGSQVRHQDYGRGIVLCVEGSHEATKVTIEFARGQTKKFVLKFANLEML